jgi:alanine dehydrogenase
LPYAVAIADKGWKQACKDDAALRKGLNIVDGDILFPGVAEAFNLPLASIQL